MDKTRAFYASLAMAMTVVPTARLSPQDSAIAPLIAAERAANQAAYRDTYLPNKESLIEHHAGQWLVIVSGTLLPMWDGIPRPTPDLRQALGDADALAPQARHRFVFRVGEEGEIAYPNAPVAAPNLAGIRLSAYLSGNLQITDNGIYLTPRDRKQTERVRIGNGTTDAGGPQLSVTAVSLDVGAPIDQPATRQGAAAGPSLKQQIELQFNPDFGGYAVLSARHAAALALHRYEIPGSLMLGANPEPLLRSRVILRQAVSGLDAMLPVGLRV